MPSTPDVRELRSPDGAHVARLERAGDVPWGPRYFSLSVDGVPFEGRIFGDAWLWSADSRYLAVQEWLSRDIHGGPATRLLIIDTAARAEAVVARTTKGWVEPLRFAPPGIGYARRYAGFQYEFEEALPGEDGWEQWDTARRRG